MANSLNLGDLQNITHLLPYLEDYKSSMSCMQVNKIQCGPSQSQITCATAWSTLTPACFEIVWIRREIVWIRRLLAELVFSKPTATPLRVDNTGTIQIAANPVFCQSSPPAQVGLVDMFFKSIVTTSGKPMMISSLLFHMLPPIFKLQISSKKPFQ